MELGSQSSESDTQQSRTSLNELNVYIRVVCVIQRWFFSVSAATLVDSSHVRPIGTTRNETNGTANCRPTNEQSEREEENAQEASDLVNIDSHLYLMLSCVDLWVALNKENQSESKIFPKAQISSHHPHPHPIPHPLIPYHHSKRHIQHRKQVQKKAYTTGEREHEFGSTKTVWTKWMIGQSQFNQQIRSSINRPTSVDNWDRAHAQIHSLPIHSAMFVLITFNYFSPTS